ncbi:MAG: translation elongation factor-like protein [Candidatus Aenigmatarchaeota archaeon]
MEDAKHLLRHCRFVCKSQGEIWGCEMGKKLIGRVTHYFDKIGVAVIELSDTLNEGDRISIEGNVTNIQQTASSIQIDRKPVQSAGKGQSVGLKVEGKAREGDKVFRIEE